MILRSRFCDLTRSLNVVLFVMTIRIDILARRAFLAYKAEKKRMRALDKCDRHRYFHVE